MLIAIDCIHTPISKRLGSHRASWAKYWKYYLESKGHEVDILYKDDDIGWNGYDEIYLYQGMEFDGVVNFIGGVADWQVYRFQKFAAWMNRNGHIPVYSIEHDMPDYHEILEKRKINIPELFGVSDRIKTVKLPDGKRQVVIGDSHSQSVMMPLTDEFVRVYRNDFKTLNGAINKGFDNFGDLSNAETATFYFGNIDARHHALRHFDYPTEAAQNYVERYYNEVLRVVTKYPKLKNIEIIGLLPMPSDDRKLPKSGFYEGTPFYGELELRQDFVDQFNYFMNKTCVNMGWNFFNWPDEFQDIDGTLSFDYMEKPRSVHLAQTSYRYDFDKGEPRYV